MNLTRNRGWNPITSPNKAGPYPNTGPGTTGLFPSGLSEKIGHLQIQDCHHFPKISRLKQPAFGAEIQQKTGTTATDQTVAIHTLHPSAVFSPALRIKFLSRSWAVLNLTMNRSPLKSKIAVKSPNWRFIARKIKYPWKIYHCQGLLPRGSGISTFVWGGSSCS